MSETQPKHNDPSVTVTIARRVKPEYKEEFEAFLTGVTYACGQFAGYLGSNVFRPVNADDPEYRIIFKFDRLSNLRRWETSTEREYWFAIAEPLTVSPPQIQVLTGLETWFTLPGKPAIAPPPRYKMALVTWLAVFPLITLISAIFQQVLAMLPLVLRVAIVTAIAVPTMTYLLMPQMTKFFAWWLYPAVEMTAPIKDAVPAIADHSQAIPLPNLQSTQAEEEQQIAISLNL
jgi:antibiotic biosynthesis monooxygenase (ABM) superfamily enzyme